MLVRWWCCPPAIPRPPGCFRCFPTRPWPAETWPRLKDECQFRSRSYAHLPTFQLMGREIELWMRVGLLLSRLRQSCRHLDNGGRGYRCCILKRNCRRNLKLANLEAWHSNCIGHKKSRDTSNGHVRPELKFLT